MRRGDSNGYPQDTFYGESLNSHQTSALSTALNDDYDMMSMALQQNFSNMS